MRFPSPFAAGRRWDRGVIAPGQRPEHNSAGPSPPSGGMISTRSTLQCDKERSMPADKSLIGKKGEPVTMHVERGKIGEFARAIKDDDPLYFDEAYAAREAGGIMPPITFLQTVSHWDDGR